MNMLMFVNLLPVMSSKTIEFTADIILEDLSSGRNIKYSTTKGDVLTVDTVGAADSSRTPGTYTLSTFTTDLPTGGTGAQFSIVVDRVVVLLVTVTNGGNGYVVDETFTVADAQLGGGGGAAFTFDVAICWSYYCWSSV